MNDAIREAHRLVVVGFARPKTEHLGYRTPKLGLMPRTLPPEMTWVVLAGKSLAELEEAAVRAAFARHGGNRTKIRAELRIGKMSLLRRLDMMGLRNRPTPRHLTEKAISLAFSRHCRDIMRELRIHESTLMRWINSKAPFAVEEK